MAQSKTLKQTLTKCVMHKVDQYEVQETNQISSYVVNGDDV